MIPRFFLSLGLVLFEVYAQEPFWPEHINRFLTQDNPYVYSAIAQEQIETARIKSAQGGLDTRLNGTYERKEYPLSESEFSNIGLKKPTESGMELMVDYRRAEGTQEYNNVKTGDDGEYRIGINLPLFAMFQGTNERKYRLDTARVTAQYAGANAQDRLRLLYNQIITAYYTLLFHHEGVILEERLLEKGQKRDAFIKKRVATGDLPELSELESRQQLIARQQRLLTAKNNYAKSLESFLQYLNLPKVQFLSLYSLPSLKDLPLGSQTLEDALNYALQNRPDLLALEKQQQQLNLDATYNSLSRLPTLDLFAYGIHDPVYGGGTKAGFNLELPLEQRSYEGRFLEQQKRSLQINAEKQTRILELQAQLRNLFTSQDALQNNIRLVREEIAISQTLEAAENKKYEVGSSDLFQVNQREIQVLNVKQKLLGYFLEALNIEQAIKKEMGKTGEFLVGR